jgi:peroxiredoxin (alkyl hydroperoxide reductase subunit C)
MIGVGQEFPEFTLNGVNPDNDIVSISRDDYDGWRVFYFYPKDFTFICPTEIQGMDLLTENAQVVGFSGDNEFCKVAWKENNSLIQNIDHVLVADCGLYLSDELGIVDEEEGVCYRATYIVDPDNVIQHVSVNALDTGRNAREILRTLEALQAGGLTGCEWQPGDEFVA